jgi:hypothetical protein
MLFLPALTRNAYMGLRSILLVLPAEGIRPGLYTTEGYVGCSKLGKYFAVHCIYLMLNESYGRAATGAQVNGFLNSLQRGYKTVEDAQAAWSHACANNSIGPSRALQTVRLASPLPPNHSTARPFLAHNMSHSVVTRAPSSIHAHKSAPASSASPLLREPHEPRSPSLGQAMPAAPARSGVFQPLPSVSSSPRRVLHAHHNHLIPPIMLTDETAYWVVTSGANPGVYYGR